MIQDMLQEGIISMSKCPFSYTVLLVKKKDDTWRLCVDYKALNVINIKACFPIPTIDELLVEITLCYYFF